MAGLITEYGGPLGEENSRRPSDVYGALLRAITGQQLSVTAAQAIYGRLLERFGGRPPTPEEILADDPDELRTAAGLSRAKTASPMSSLSAPARSPSSAPSPTPSRLSSGPE